MYYGKYRARVVDINDPEKRGRIKVECPNVLGAQISNWALPCLPPFIFYVPRLDSLIWIEFEEGKVDSPIWTGNFYTSETWSTGAGVYDHEVGIINLPIASQIRTLKTLNVVAVEDMFIETQATLNTHSVSDTIIVTDTNLNLETADTLTANSGADINLNAGGNVNTRGNVNANVGSSFNVNG